MCKILIIYHSQTGNTKEMAEHVVKGAHTIEKVEVILKRAADASPRDLLECDGLIIGSPEYFGDMAGMIKDFFDRTYYAVREKKEVFKKPYAVFISAGNDGTGALNNIKRLCTGYQFKEVFHPVLAKGKIDLEILGTCEEMGATLAAGCKEKIY